MVQRSFNEMVYLPQSGPTDWDLWAAVDAYLAAVVPDDMPSYLARLRDGSVRANSFEELRANAEQEAVTEVNTWRYLPGGETKLGFHATVQAEFSTAYVTATGPDRAWVVGTAEALRRDLESGRLLAARPPEPATAAPPEPEPQPWWRTLLRQPNPWVLTIAATVIGGLIVVLLTN